MVTQGRGQALELVAESVDAPGKKHFFFVAAAGELLRLGDKADFVTIWEARRNGPNAIKEDWKTLLKKAGKGGVMVERRLRAGIWLGYKAAISGLRNQGDSFAALEVAIKAYLVSGEVAKDLRERFSSEEATADGEGASSTPQPEQEADAHQVDEPSWGQRFSDAIDDKVLLWLKGIECWVRENRYRVGPVHDEARRKCRIALLAVGVMSAVIVATHYAKEIFVHREDVPLLSVGHVPPQADASPAPPPSQQRVTKPPQPAFDNTHGWGPERQTFTSAHPAPYAVFNSITDRVPHGDERNFMQCHDKEDRHWDTSLVARDGHAYECFLLFSNDVAENLGQGNTAAQMHNARVRAILPGPSTYNPGIVGHLSADNAMAVWASCNFLAARPITITYLPKTARMFTNRTPVDGLRLAETYADGGDVVDGLVGQKGALLGTSSQDGVLRQDAGYVLFDVKVALDPK
ncbi:hypothetical protein GCM10023192_34740 [Amycolatopsis samaneae]